MTLFEVIRSFQTIAATNPYIRSVGDGSIFDFMNANPSIRYAVFFVSQTNHREDEYWDYYGFNLFCIDRLVDNLEDNRLQVQSIAKSVIGNTVKTFINKYVGVTLTTEINYTPFTERFTDECAGMYASVELRIPKAIVCEEEFKEIIPIDCGGYTKEDLEEAYQSGYTQGYIDGINNPDYSYTVYPNPIDLVKPQPDPTEIHIDTYMSWTARTDEDWIHIVNPTGIGSSIVELVVDDASCVPTQYGVRDGHITISFNKVSDTVIVDLYQPTAVFKQFHMLVDGVETNVISFPSTGGSKDVDIVTEGNCRWICISPIPVSQESGEGNATITFESDGTPIPEEDRGDFLYYPWPCDPDREEHMYFHIVVEPPAN